MPPLPKTQLDKLGTRLKEDAWTDADLRLLDTYRRSFAGACDDVMTLLRDELGLSPTARPAKSTTSIIDKLKRESVRLTQIQDIAGCRVIVEDVLSQDRITERLRGRLQDLSVVDRRKAPSHGYRAVHVIVRIREVSIEIQLRTELQHSWAELSEKLADSIGHDLKYGSGDERVREVLMQWSELVARFEDTEVMQQTLEMGWEELHSEYTQLLGIDLYDQLPLLGMDRQSRERRTASKRDLARDLSELAPYLIDLGKGAP